MNLGLMFDVSNLENSARSARNKARLRNELIKKARTDNKTSEPLGMATQVALGTVGGGLLGYLLSKKYIGDGTVGGIAGAQLGLLTSVVAQAIGGAKGYLNPNTRTSEEQVAYERSGKEKILNYLVPGRAGYNAGLTSASLDDLTNS